MPASHTPILLPPSVSAITNSTSQFIPTEFTLKSKHVDKAFSFSNYYYFLLDYEITQMEEWELCNHHGKILEKNWEL